MSELRAVLAGSGIAVPPREVPNDLLARVMETNDAWIVERSGVRSRRYVERGVTASDLGAEAAQAALANAGMAADEIDYIVCATMTPDHFFPGAGTLIQQKLGIRPVPALDIRQQCASDAGRCPQQACRMQTLSCHFRASASCLRRGVSSG